MSKKARTIVVDDNEYKYKIGKQNVVIRSDGKQFDVLNFSTLTGIPWNEIERME